MSVGNQQILLRTSINNNKRAKEKMRKKGRKKGSARKHTRCKIKNIANTSTRFKSTHWKTFLFD